MNKIGLIKKLAIATQLKEKQISFIVEKMLSICSENLAAGDAIRLSGFGTLKTRYREARMGQLPKTREKVLIPGGRIALFSAGKRLREQLMLTEVKETNKKNLK